MSKKLTEEQIQEEIRRRVFVEEERKQQLVGVETDKEVLAEMTSLSPAEIEKISQSVRQELAQKQAQQSQFMRKTIIAAVVIAVVMGVFTVMQYNTMVRLNEEVNTKWGQVENVYQRRLDLVPNLVRTVQAYAEHEKEIFQLVTDARAKAGGTLSSGAALQDAASYQQFQQAQTQLSSALGRMLALVESTPEIKGDQNFLALQAQLEGSENRISVERKRFNEAVQTYNAHIKRFPQGIFAGIFGFKEKTYFQAEPGAEKAPEVNFN